MMTASRPGALEALRGVHQGVILMRPDDTAPVGAVLIPLFRRDGSVRVCAVVDADDAEWTAQWRWSMSNNGYASRQVWVGGRPQTILLHRDLLGLSRGDGLEGDHVNRDRLDNRRQNLRTVSQAANRQNTGARRGASSAHRGVSWYKRYGKWVAYVGVGGKFKNLGYFDNELEAAEVAKQARLRLLPYAVEDHL